MASGFREIDVYGYRTTIRSLYYAAASYQAVKTARLVRLRQSTTSCAAQTAPFDLAALPPEIFEMVVDYIVVGTHEALACEWPVLQICQCENEKKTWSKPLLANAFSSWMEDRGCDGTIVSTGQTAGKAIWQLAEEDPSIARLVKEFKGTDIWEELQFPLKLQAYDECDPCISKWVSIWVNMAEAEGEISSSNCVSLDEGILLYGLQLADVGVETQADKWKRIIDAFLKDLNLDRMRYDEDHCYFNEEDEDSAIYIEVVIGPADNDCHDFEHCLFSGSLKHTDSSLPPYLERYKLVLQKYFMETWGETPGEWRWQKVCKVEVCSDSEDEDKEEEENAAPRLPSATTSTSTEGEEGMQVEAKVNEDVEPETTPLVPENSLGTSTSD